MKKYEVTFDLSATYEVEVQDNQTEDDAIDIAEEWFAEAIPSVEVARIDEPSEETEAKMKILKEMDDFLRNYNADESVYYDVWCFVYPDEADDIDRREIAENTELWVDCIQAFARCCRIMGVID